MTETSMTAAPSSFRVGAVFNRTFELLSRDFVKFFLLTVIAWLPFLLFLLISLGGDGGAPGNEAARAGLGAVSVLLWGAFSVLGQAVIFYGAFQQMLGRSFAVGESLKRGLARFFPIIGLLICLTLGVGLGFVLLIIPGVILWVMWSVAAPVCVVEGAGPFASLSRSAELTKGNRWRIFGVLFVIGMVNQIVQGIVQLGLAAAAGALVGAIGTFLWMALAQTFSSIAVAVIYHDLRVAQEGIDVERIAAVFD
jgi:hypothetical protein